MLPSGNFTPLAVVSIIPATVSFDMGFVVQIQIFQILVTVK